MNPKVTIKKNSDFRRIYAKGKTAVTPTLVVYAAKNREGLSRAGFTVSAKFANAVNRNRTKRRLREIYRSTLPALSRGKDIIVVARSKAVSSDYYRLDADFVSACEKLDLMRESE